MKKLMLAFVFVLALATPALADGGDYPPTVPPCVDCHTADTGFTQDGLSAAKVAGLFLVVGLGALYVARRRTT